MVKSVSKPVCCSPSECMLLTTVKCCVKTLWGMSTQLASHTYILYIIRQSHMQHTNQPRGVFAPGDRRKNTISTKCKDQGARCKVQNQHQRKLERDRCYNKMQLQPPPPSTSSGSAQTLLPCTIDAAIINDNLHKGTQISF